MTSRFDSPARLAAACARNWRRLHAFGLRFMSASVLTCYRTPE
jgi:hypothetical protein